MSLMWLFHEPLPAGELHLSGYEEDPHEVARILNEAFDRAPEIQDKRSKRVVWAPLEIDKDPLIVFVGLISNPYLILELLAMQIAIERLPKGELRLIRDVRPGPFSRLLTLQRYIAEVSFEGIRRGNTDSPPWGLVTGHNANIVRPRFLTWFVTQVAPEKVFLEITGVGNEKDVFPAKNLEGAREGLSWLLKMLELHEQTKVKETEESEEE